MLCCTGQSLTLLTRCQHHDMFINFTATRALSSLVTEHIPECRSSGVTSGFVVGTNEKKARLIQLASSRCLTKQLCALCTSSPSALLRSAPPGHAPRTQSRTAIRTHAHTRACTCTMAKSWLTCWKVGVVGSAQACGGSTVAAA